MAQPAYPRCGNHLVFPHLRFVPRAVISMGVRSRFWRFEDVSVGAEEVSSCFAQALELAIPLLQIISWNVVPGRNEIANSGADGQQRLPSEQPSVTRRRSAASIKKSTLKYQTIESYAPPAPMSGANRGLTAWPEPLRKISDLVAGDQFGDVSKLFSQSRSAFARFAVRHV
jgi:hypothetical protein